MAVNLIKSDHKVVVFDVIADCIQPVAAEGAQVGLIKKMLLQYYYTKLL